MFETTSPTPEIPNKHRSPGDHRTWFDLRHITTPLALIGRLPAGQLGEMANEIRRNENLNSEGVAFSVGTISVPGCLFYETGQETLSVLIAWEENS